MDITYDMFRRLMVNWQRSIEFHKARPEFDKPSRGPEQHARRLITYCGYSTPCGSMDFEED